MKLRYDIFLYDLKFPYRNFTLKNSWFEPLTPSSEWSCMLSPLSNDQIEIHDFPKKVVNDSSIKPMDSSSEIYIQNPLQSEKYFKDFFMSFVYANYLDRCSLLLQAYSYYVKAADGLHVSDPKRVISLYRATLCLFRSFASHQDFNMENFLVTSKEEYYVKQMIDTFGGYGVYSLNQQVSALTVRDRIKHLYKAAKLSEKSGTNFHMLSERVQYIVQLGNRVSTIIGEEDTTFMNYKKPVDKQSTTLDLAKYSDYQLRIKFPFSIRGFNKIYIVPKFVNDFHVPNSIVIDLFAIMILMLMVILIVIYIKMK